MAKQARILTGRVAAITGGARGIGKSTAKALVAQGMKVGIGDLDLETAKATAAEIGGATEAFALDVTKRDSIAAFLDGVEEKLGPLDVLVNNAGIMPLGPFLAEDDLSMQRQIDINVNGVMFGVKEALPRLLPRHSGHIVNIASMAGKAGFAGGVTYCGTKHFVVGASEALRGELRGSGIEVSCVMPIPVNTELATGLVPTRGVKKVEPEDVADAIVDALRFPRFDVYVPKSMGPMTYVTGLLPRNAREAVGRVMKADKVLAGADLEARRGYELRAAKSEPGLEPGDGAKELGEGSSG